LECEKDKTILRFVTVLCFAVNGNHKIALRKKLAEQFNAEQKCFALSDDGDGTGGCWQGHFSSLRRRENK